MNTIARQLKEAIRNLEPLIDADNAIRVAGIRFQYAASTPAVEDIVRSIHGKPQSGVALQKTTAELRQWLKKNRISYIAEDGYLAVFTERQTIEIRPSSPSLAPYISMKGPPHFRATRLVSPASFKILDAIVRLPATQIKQTKNQELAKTLEISPSALSKVLSTFDAKDLWEMRASIQKISLDAWMDALDEPRTSRQFTPFFKNSHAYKIPDDAKRLTPELFVQEILQKFKSRVIAGPLELAKAKGLIVDDQITFWCEPEILNKVKKEFRLIPALAVDRVFCHIACPKNSFQKEAIVSPYSNYGEYGLPDWIQSHNLLRMVWDLGYGDSRVSGTRKELLEKILAFH